MPASLTKLIGTLNGPVPYFSPLTKFLVVGGSILAALQLDQAMHEVVRYHSHHEPIPFATPAQYREQSFLDGRADAMLLRYIGAHAGVAFHNYLVSRANQGKPNQLESI